MITFNSPNPQQLLASLREAIAKGHITTWSEEGGYFTHTPAQWARKAWLQPIPVAGELRFAIINSRGFNVTTEVYAVYHGRFIETMLAHFDRQFSGGFASAMPTLADKVAA
jgi:hypothetical protein